MTDIFSERKYRIPTPEQTYLEFSYAGFAKRALAAAIDAIIVGMVWFFIVLITTLVSLIVTMPIGQDNGVRLNLGLIILIVSISLTLLAPFLYHFLLEYYWNGQTMGKHLLNIRVIRQDGVRVDVVSALLRNLFRYIDALPLIPYPYLFGVWICLLSKYEQRIGDMIAGTVVVALPKRASAKELSAVSPEVSLLSGLGQGGQSSRKERVKLLREFLAVRDKLSGMVRAELVNEFAVLFGLAEISSLEEKEFRLMDVAQMPMGEDFSSVAI